MLLFIALVTMLSLCNGDEEKGVLDCLIGPCVTVPGVGKLHGSNLETSFSGRSIKGFWGIPFGETTGGEHRFQPPRPKAPINDGNDAYDATYLSYISSWWDFACPQAGMGATEKFENSYLAQFFAQQPENSTKGNPLGPMIGSEDCLRLAVYTPQLPAGNSNPKLPVMVYIHGGSFMLGSYIGAGPKKLLERDMILVEIQYRVGPLGFMCLPDDEIAGNMGLLDQALALKWVNEHITYFGGDPDRVTIQGESAGAASATYHMISPISQPYFQQAIVQSGSALSSWAFDSEPETHAHQISQIMGCPIDTNAKLINCLKNEKSAVDIINAHKTYYHSERADARMGFGGSVPCAQTHGAQKFIIKHPKQYLSDGIANGSPSPKRAIFGSNQHEGSFVLGMIYNSYIKPNHVTTNEHFLRHQFSATLLEALGLKDDSGVIYELINYRFFEDNELGDWCMMIDGLVNLVGTFFIKASTYEFMKFNDLIGSESYYYSFEYYGAGSLWNFLFPGEAPPIPRGVTHGDELLYIFSTGVFEHSEEDWDMAYKMSNMWANFVIYGNPTPPEFPIDGVPNWPLWQDNSMNYLKIDSTPEVLANYIGTWEASAPPPDSIPCGTH